MQHIHVRTTAATPCSHVSYHGLSPAVPASEQLKSLLENHRHQLALIILNLHSTTFTAFQ